MAGSSVREMAIESRTTIVAPPARLFHIVEGMISIPLNAKTTVRPLNSTARLAVAPAAAIASFFSSPAARSSR